MRDQKVQFILTPAASPDLPPPNLITTPPSLSHNTPLQSVAAETLKTGAPSEPSRRPGGRLFFSFSAKERRIRPEQGGGLRGGVWPKPGGGQWWGGGYVPQCSDYRGLKETRRWRGAWHRGWRDPASSGPGGASPLLDSRGGWGVFQPRRGVASPPQPPPFLTGLIFHFNWSSSSSNFCFFSSRFSWWWFCWCPDTKRRLGLPFSEAGSWRRDLAAASVSAAGGAAPAPTGPAASWSSTRSTAGEETKRTFKTNDFFSYPRDRTASDRTTTTTEPNRIIGLKHLTKPNYTQ